MVLICEVLEHVEKPLEFLTKATRIMSEDSKLFITTPLYAGQRDHIYLFRTTEQVMELIQSAGLEVVGYIEVPVAKRISIEKSKRDKLTIMLGFECKRAKGIRI